MSLRYVEAPTEWDGRNGVFLAGGITGCPDWQAELRGLVNPELPRTLLNPRRADFPIGDPNASETQVEWEWRHLRRATTILFWFPAENAAGCPIALYELGAWSMTDKRIAVGVEPGYVREADVRIQTRLARPEVPVVSTLQELAEWV